MVRAGLQREVDLDIGGHALVDFGSLIIVELRVGFDVDPAALEGTIKDIPAILVGQRRLAFALEQDALKGLPLLVGDASEYGRSEIPFVCHDGYRKPAESPVIALKP